MFRHRILIANVLLFLFLLIAADYLHYVYTIPSDNTDGSFFSADEFVIHEVFGKDNPLNAGDVITHIDGKSLETLGSENTTSSEKGDELVYTVIRNSGKLTIPVKLGDSNFKFLIFRILSTITGVMVALIGYWALISSKEFKLNLSFFIVSLGIAFLTLPSFTQAHLAMGPAQPEATNGITAVFHTLSLAGIAAAIYFFATFPIDLLGKFKKTFGIVEAIVIIGIQTIPLLITSDFLRRHAAYVQLETIFWTLHGVIMILILGINLITVKKRTTLQKQQLKYVLLGLAIPTVVTIPFLYLPFMLGGVGLIPSTFSYISFVFFPLCIFIAMRKYKLLLIDRFFSKTFQYSLLVLTSSLLYGIVLYAMLIFFGQSLTSTQLAAVVATFAFTILVLTPIQIFLSKITDRIFHRKFLKLIDASELALKEITFFNKYKDLYAYLNTIFPQRLGIKNMDLLVIKDGKEFVSLNKFSLDKWDSIIAKGGKDFGFLRNLHSASLVDDFRNISVPYIKDFEVIIPIKRFGKFKGIWLIGEKNSEDFFYPEDLEIFSVIGKQLFLTLHNIELIEELKEKAAREKEVLKKEVELKALKEEYITVISHYLRTPLTSIRGHLELIQEGKDKKTDREKSLGAIGIAAQKLETLTEEIIAISSLEKGRLNLVRRPASLGEIVKKQTMEMKSLAKEYNVKIKGNVEDDVESLIDKSKIKMVVNNILENAIIFNKENGNVAITLRRVGKNAVITVTDTGIGISRDEIKKLFIPFHRAHFSKEYFIKGEGPGLGLYISKLIIDAHEGNIEIKSKEGKGTVVKITIPIKKNE